jgi:hypothetical protein
VTELTSFDMGNQAMGTDTIVDGAPGIECLACGATWRDLAAFRAEQAGGLRPAGTTLQPDPGEPSSGRSTAPVIVSPSTGWPSAPIRGDPNFVPGPASRRWSFQPDQ